MPESPLLSVERLSIQLPNRAIVQDVSFSLGSECVALVGESGSGKSLTARALLGLLQPPLRSRATHLKLGEVDLQSCTQKQWNTLRGSRIALMLQDPRHSLNPVLSVGRQLDLALRVHQHLAAGQRRDRVAAALDAVGLTQAKTILASFPHQLSGGMGQRVVLALTLLNDPQVLIADEPTSALDANLRDQIMDLIRSHVQTRRMGLLLISHDLKMVARHADRVLVMHRGSIVDEGPAAGLSQSQHPYTHALWAAHPSGKTYGTVLPT